MNDIAINEESKELAQVGTADFLLQPEVMKSLEHFAIQMAKGKSTVPAHLQGAPADCMAIAMQAAQWGMNPYAVAQKTHLVNGTLGYEAQLVNAVIGSSRAIKGRFKYEWQGEGVDNLSCRAGAVLTGEKEITWGQPVFAAQQTVKNSPLWKTDPRQQLAYLAVKKWARLYTPDVLLGVYTPDELETIAVQGVEIVQEEDKPSRTQAIKDKVKARREPEISEVDVETGEVLTSPQQWTYDELIKALGDCVDAESFAALKDAARVVYKKVGKQKQETITSLIDSLRAELEEVDHASADQA